MFLLVSILCFSILLFNTCGGRSDGNRANGANRANRNNEPSNSANSVNSANAANSAINANSSNSNTTSEIFERPEDISKGLLQMEDAWNEAYVKRDEAWFQQNLADDYTEIGDSGKTINDKAGAIAAMKADKSTEIVAELSDTKVRVEGNAAIVTGVNHVRLKDENGRPQDYKHRYTDTYIKRDGRWLIWANESTRMP